MKHFHFAAALLTAAVSLAACTGTPTPTPTPDVPATPAAFFENNGVAVQVKTVQVGSTPATVTFAGGTALTFATNSVLDAGGNAYSGPVQVSVREVRSKADMVLSNVLTVSNDQPLVSGGMFSLDIKTPAGAELKINPAQGVAAAVPAVGKLNDRMQQFVGNVCKDAAGLPCVPPTPPAGASSVDWQPVAGQFGINASTTPGSYVFSVFNKGWINCDFFYSDPRPKGTIHVGFDPINDLNTVMFLIPQGVNTVIALYTTDGPNKRKSYANSLPIGLNAEVVALTFNGGKQYLAHKSVVVADGLNETLTFAEATDAEIKAYLATQN